MRWFWDHYIGRDVDRSNPLVSPLRAHSFKGLPPALVITAEFDPLRDEGSVCRAFEDRGCPGAAQKVRRNDSRILYHGGIIDQGTAAIAQAAAALRTAFQS